MNNGRVIDGILKINGEKVCHTAENADSALSPGTYNILLLSAKTYDQS